STAALVDAAATAARGRVRPTVRPLPAVDSASPSGFTAFWAFAIPFSRSVMSAPIRTIRPCSVSAMLLFAALFQLRESGLHALEVLVSTTPARLLPLPIFPVPDEAHSVHHVDKLRLPSVQPRPLHPE